MIVRPGIPEELRWFSESRFGMFIHFGLYALLGRGEWVMYHERIPRSEYEKLQQQFNPHRFHAEEWVDLAQEAGARYLTVTTKHHDGFCLFDSALTDFKITNTPFGRDLIAELTAACQRRGLRIIFYYSQPDWHHPNYVHQRGAFKDLDDPPATDQPSWPLYQEYLEGQVRELCTRYGRIDGIWFDGSHKTEEEWRGQHLYQMIKALHPHAVVNDRARYGDFFTPERHLPEDLTGYLFEACQSVSPTAWGYRADTPLFSVPHLVQSLVKVASAGGNFLLNVGPAPDGTIPNDQAARMRGVGDWLRRHGEAIYGTEAGPVLPDPNLRATLRNRTLYVHILAWPETDRLLLPGIPVEDVARAALLVDDTPLHVAGTPDGAEVRGLPAVPPDPSVNVIAVTLKRVRDALRRKSAPEIVGPVVPVSASGTTHLTAEQAGREGRAVKGARLALRPARGDQPAYLTGWMVPEQVAYWNLRCETPGTYAVSVWLRCRQGHEGAVAKIVVGSQERQAEVPDTGDPPEWREVQVGTVSLPAGEVRLALMPHRLKWGYLFADVRGVTLRPVS